MVVPGGLLLIGSVEQSSTSKAHPDANPRVSECPLTCRHVIGGIRISVRAGDMPCVALRYYAANLASCVMPVTGRWDVRY
eukprot:1796903-Rhodomonas_salina.1